MTLKLIANCKTLKIGGLTIKSVLNALFMWWKRSDPLIPWHTLGWSHRLSVLVSNIGKCLRLCKINNLGILLQMFAIYDVNWFVKKKQDPMLPKPKWHFFRNQNSPEIWALHYTKVLPSEDLKSYNSVGEGAKSMCISLTLSIFFLTGTLGLESNSNHVLSKPFWLSLSTPTPPLPPQHGFLTMEKFAFHERLRLGDSFADNWLQLLRFDSNKITSLITVHV